MYGQLLSENRSPPVLILILTAVRQTRCDVCVASSSASRKPSIPCEGVRSSRSLGLRVFFYFIMCGLPLSFTFPSGSGLHQSRRLNSASHLSGYQMNTYILEKSANAVVCYEHLKIHHIMDLHFMDGSRLSSRPSLDCPPSAFSFGAGVSEGCVLYVCRSCRDMPGDRHIPHTPRPLTDDRTVNR